MSIIVTKGCLKKILKFLGNDDECDDDAEVRLRQEVEQKGVEVSFPEYNEDGEHYIE